MDTDKNKFNPIECNDNDVISFGKNTFKIERITTAVNKSSNQALANQIKNILNAQKVNIQRTGSDSWFQEGSDSWFQEGIDCEILTLGAKEWRKGKMKFKLSVEFYIEEEDTINNDTSTESPLDDIRRKISEATS